MSVSLCARVCLRLIATRTRFAHSVNSQVFGLSSLETPPSAINSLDDHPEARCHSLPVTKLNTHHPTTQEIKLWTPLYLDKPREYIFGRYYAINKATNGLTVMYPKI